MNVEDVMTREVRTCRSTDSLELAARLMWDGDLGCVPVVDEAKKPIGIVTDRDICMAAMFHAVPISRLSVVGTMATTVHVAHIGDTMQSAVDLMRTKQVRRLPVVDAAGQLYGLISLNDVALATGDAPVRPVNPVELTAAMASICQPRRAPAH
jgi:CBS domain-containing protein